MNILYMTSRNANILKKLLEGKARLNHNFLNHKTSKTKDMLKQKELERERNEQMNSLYSSYVGRVSKNEPYLQKAYNKLREMRVIQDVNTTRSQIKNAIQKRQQKRQEEQDESAEGNRMIREIQEQMA